MLTLTLRCLLAAAVGAAPLWPPVAGRPPGDPGAYSFLSRRSGHTAIARWDPCSPVTYRVNPAHAPHDSLPEVRAAVARVAAATGLVFHYAGRTDVVPGRDARNFPPGTGLVIAWAPPGSVPADTDRVGVGGATYYPVGGELVIVRAMVVLDAAASAGLARGFGAAPGGTTGRLLLHELGHAVGLAHPETGDPYEIMQPRLSGRAATWGAGDLAGLRAVGAGAGCADDVFTVRAVRR